MLSVRPATVDDVDFVVAAHELPHARGFVHPAPADLVRAAMIEPKDRVTFIVTENGERIGMFLLGYEAEQPWLIELRRIVIASPGRGYGKFAVNWILEWSFGQLCAHRIWLEVVESNDRARRLYESAGFVLEGTYRDGYRDEDGKYANLCFYGLLKTDLARE